MDIEQQFELRVELRQADGTERMNHAYKSPVEGYCYAFVDLGPLTGRVRCSFKAVLGKYCRTHAKNVPVDELWLPPDPPMPKDGTCAQCGEPRDKEVESKTADDHRFKQPLAKRKRAPGMKALAQAEKQSDPFCSTECCRAFHGCSLPVKPIGGRKKVY